MCVADGTAPTALPPPVHSLQQWLLARTARASAWLHGCPRAQTPCGQPFARKGQRGSITAAERAE